MQSAAAVSVVKPKDYAQWPKGRQVSDLGTRHSFLVTGSTLVNLTNGNQTVVFDKDAHNSHSK
ncbi:MAG: hypothetical protein ACPGJU_11195 [Coraliomargarita sp.]